MAILLAFTSVYRQKCYVMHHVKFATIYLLHYTPILSQYQHEKWQVIFFTSKYTLKEALLDKSRMKCISNTVVSLNSLTL